MVDFIRSWVFNVVTLVIFIVLIEILTPSGKTKKFISLVSGFILLVAILNPLLGIFDKGVDLKDIRISDSNFIDKQEIETSSKILNESQTKQIIKAYRKKLIGQLEDCTADIKGVSGVKADVLINEDINSKSFGEIKRAYFVLVPGEKNEAIKPVAKVGRIQIKMGEEAEKTSVPVDGETKKQIESRVNKIFGLEKENVVITVQENR
ncbi:MAG: stage III sporulation protein AF [Clostridia bacterium]|nr:stage III sporulation protein AF [Clostridia bacterium]